HTPETVVSRRRAALYHIHIPAVVDRQGRDHSLRRTRRNSIITQVQIRTARRDHPHQRRRLRVPATVRDHHRRRRIVAVVVDRIRVRHTPETVVSRRRAALYHIHIPAV